jgi:enoyl-CoA hydratase/carnithine racemase
MSEFIQSQLQERVLRLRLNRPDKKNALTQAMYLTLAEALAAAAVNPEVRVLLLAGVPDAFSSGNDLQDFLKNPPSGDDAPVARFMRALAGFPKPVIAAVNGVAIGIGVTLLLHSDLVYAGKGTRLQMPFANIGICPEFASTYLLPRIMGNARAAELLMFGETFSADKALEYGLVNVVLADAEVEPYALQRALKLAQQPPNALRVTKKMMRRWTESTVLDAIKLEADHLIPMLGQEEAQEAMTAFMQKRKPDFSRFS